jgi:amino acid adenylation domain-containing protein
MSMQRPVFFEQFELQARLHRDHSAIDTADQAFTYAWLSEESNRIAHALLRSGMPARQREVVGLLLPAGADYVAGLLGVSKAGAAFLPLPIDLPPARLHTYLARAKCRFVITLAEHRALLEGLPLRCLTPADWATETAEAGPGIAIGPTDPCYVMFTSGSTGEPKAILGQHRGLSHFLRWEMGELGLDEGVRGSWLAPITFDVSLRDVLVPLMCGGTVCLPAQDIRTQPHRLVAWLREQRVSLVHCVPTVLRLLNRAMADAVPVGEPPTLPRFPALRHLLVAGEPLLASDVTTWRRLAGTDTQVLNLYGPSETTLAKLFLRVGALAEDDRSVLPIGRPLPNTVVHVLRDAQACLPGEIGEICIATPYRSLGYLHDPALTASVFVRNPLSQDPADVVYRTGDLGRLLPDGTIQCLGRQDGQVKLNGVRIELAEIESVLRQVPGVAQCACAVHGLSDQRALLVGYYVLQDGLTEAIAPEVLRQHLDQHLPAAMQPHRVMRLPALPTTVSGKVNRKALPKPSEVYYEAGGFVAASTPTEHILAAIWAELLDLQEVGVTTDFQTLGGDSLRAIRALMKLYQGCGVEISLRDFYALSTIQALAAHIDRLSDALAAPVSAIARVPDRASYPASPAQDRLWRLDRMGIAPTAYNLPTAYEVAGEVDLVALRAALQDVIGRHESLRTVFVEVEGHAQQRVLATMDAPLQVVDLRGHLLDAADQEADRLQALNDGHAFDLAHGPLLRVVVVRLPAAADGESRQRLLFNVHHIVSDVWSLSVLAAELAQAYAARRSGDQPDWAPLSVQQRDVVAWQSDRLQTGRIDRDRSYWLQQFATVPQALDLPTDRPRPATQTFRGSTCRRQLSERTTAALQHLAQAQGCTLFVLLDALVKVQLFRYTGQPDIVVGTPVAGREHADLQGQIGYLVNVLALRDRLDAAQPFASLLDEVGRTVHDALTHQGYAFDLLVDGLSLARDMSRSPLFDVMVVVDTFEPVALVLEATTVRPCGSENAWNFSRFDLVFHFQIEDGHLVLDLNYNSDLFDSPRIERSCAHFETLADAVTLAPHTPVGELAWIPPAELQRLQGFSCGPVQPRAPLSITALYAAIVHEHADRPAVVEAGRTWSHAELQADSDALAMALRDRMAVATGDRVGVWARRSRASLVALLGILKAGAVYVPLDPAYPVDRVRMLVDKSGSRLVLADDPAQAAQVPDCGAPVCDVLALLDTPALAMTPLPLVPPAPGDAAYMVFTSGSTGEPKGVLCEHGGFVNMALGQIEAFGLTPQDRVLQFASPAFDASLANLFMALLAGAAVVQPEPAALESAAHFAQTLVDTGTTVVTLPPTFLRTLDGMALPTLRVLITAGEAAAVQELCHYAGTLAAFNAYGPTETSVCATLQRVTPTDATRTRLPIGRPLPNTVCHVVDASNQMVPIGVPGELIIAGLGVARGYHGDDALTRLRFGTEGASGLRTYRSGDRVCWLEDGSLDFLGREDDQVKISGFRIEPMEVEHALRSCADVADGVVVPVARADGSLALAAYYCSAPRVELWPSVAEFYVYDDVVYSSMANDVERNRRYSGAFAAHLKGKVVLDIGTGPFAILSRLAIDAGAARVYAVDLLESTAAKARQMVEQLGLSDRITVLHGDARTIELPELADVCISEIVGGIGGSEGAADIINHARRLLKNPAAMLPQRSVTRLAAVNLPEGSFDWGFPEVAAHYVERIFSDIGRPFDLRLCVKNLPAQAIVSTVGVLEDLDYTRPMALEATHMDELVIQRAGPVTGLLAWLQLHVDADHVVDILENPASWLPVYIPLDLGDVDFEPGDRVQLSVHRTLAHNGFNPDFHLNGFVQCASGRSFEFYANSLHFGDGHRATPFMARLFEAEGVPRATRSGVQDIRAALARRLPAYAVPAYVVELAQLPLNVSGKVDRKALPSPTAVAVSDVTRMETPVERMLRHVWQTVLGRDPIGLDEDFFMLGGDSIRAIQIVSRLRRLKLRAEIQDIFQHPTIASLALALRPMDTLAEQGEVSGATALTPIQQWFLGLSGDAPHHFNQAIGVQQAGRWDRTALRQALQALWQHHDGLRLQLPCFPKQVAPVITLAQGGPAFLEVTLDASDAAGLAAAAAQLHASFRLDIGAPLFGALLVHDPVQDHLLLAAHHFVVDRVSWDILAEDFETAYESARQGAAAVLPFKGSSVLDHVAFLERVVQDADLSAMRGYLSGLNAPSTPLAVAGVRRAGDMVTLSEKLAVDATQALMRRATTEGGGLENLLLAGLAIALRDGLRRESTLVTLESHGRQWPKRFSALAPSLDLSRTVGWFTTYAILRLDAPQGLDLMAVAAGVRTSREAIPDGGWTCSLLDQLPEMAAGRRRRQADIGFNYLGVVDAATTGAHQFPLDWSPAGEPIGADTRSPHAMDVLCLVADGQLECSLTFDPVAVASIDAQHLLQVLMQALTPGHVPAASGTTFTYQMSGEDLDELLDLD